LFTIDYLLSGSLAMASSTTSYIEREKYEQTKERLNKAVMLVRQLKQRLKHRTEMVERVQERERSVQRELREKQTRLIQVEQQLDAAQGWQTKFQRDSQLWERQWQDIERVLRTHGAGADENHRLLAQLKRHADYLWTQLTIKTARVSDLEAAAVDAQTAAIDDQRRAAAENRRLGRLLADVDKMVKHLELKERTQVHQNQDLRTKLADHVAQIGQLQRTAVNAQAQIVQLAALLDHNSAFPFRAYPMRPSTDGDAASKCETYGVVENTLLYRAALRDSALVLTSLENLARWPNLLCKDSMDPKLPSIEEVDLVMLSLRQFTTKLRARAHSLYFVGSPVSSPITESPTTSLRTVEEEEDSLTDELPELSMIEETELDECKTQCDADKTSHSQEDQNSAVSKSGKKKKTDNEVFPPSPDD
jgi:hypothetical protein